MSRYDLIAIGGGTAGLVTAAGASALGLRTALVEREALGGDCLWTGCVPSKAMIASARLARRMRDADRLGLIGAPPVDVFAAVMHRMRQARDTIARHDDPERFRSLGVDVRFGAARVTGPKEVEVDGVRLHAPRLVVATGARPILPDIPGLAGAPVLTHVNAFDQEHLPARIVIIGGGPIGLEFAQVYARLGASVTVVEIASRILGNEESAAAETVRQALGCDGVTVYTGTTVRAVVRGPTETTVRLREPGGGETAVTCDAVFVATGRQANTDGLGLEAIGVRTDRGAVRVGPTLRSSVRSIWAAGDVTGGLQFTHVADYQAKLVLRNAVFPFSSRARYDVVPWVTFTDPEVARVGMTETDATARFGAAVSVFCYDLNDLDRAVVDAEARGFVKIVTGRRNRILGATIVASGAGDLLQPIVLAMKQRMPLSRLSQIIYPYPTMAEGVKRAADAYYREKLAGRTGTWLRRVVRWLA